MYSVHVHVGSLERGKKHWLTTEWAWYIFFRIENYTSACSNEHALINTCLGGSHCHYNYILAEFASIMQ